MTDVKYNFVFIFSKFIYI